MLADAFSSRCSMVNAIEGRPTGPPCWRQSDAGLIPRSSLPVANGFGTESVEPGEQRGAYGKYYSIYRSLYLALKDAFQSISESSEG